MNAAALSELARAVLDTEAAAVSALKARIDQRFAHACELILACEGRVVVMGMGKSGHIGGKIAATLASTGTPAFFVHPGEASHGDLGMITRKDLVLALSNSGETDELLTVIPVIRRLGVPLVALTGKPESRLGQHATVCLDVSVAKEACPLGLAPTASTTASLAMGDALAIALLEARGFGAEDFALAHPGGQLGRRLLLHIDDIMRRGKDLPQVAPDTLLVDALLEISRKGLGFTAIADGTGKVIGVYTDGDLRRSLDHQTDIHRSHMHEVMNANFKSAHPGQLAADALRVMEEHRINALPVIDETGRMIGAFNMHDLLRAGVV